MNVPMALWRVQERHNVEKCNQCGQFPCEKIQDMLKRSEEYREKCAQVCSPEEYALLEKLFSIKNGIC